MAVALKEEGHSYNAIAGALGAGYGTVYRDVNKSTYPGGQVDEPDRIVGLDEKSRPARREVEPEPRAAAVDKI